MLTFKNKLLLTKAQEIRVNSWISVCRMVYNLSLEVRISAWRNKQQQVHRFDLTKQVTELRNEYDWVKDVPADSLNYAVMRLDDAYKRFFKGSGFPKWASKRSYTSITVRQANKGTLRVENGRLQINKLGFIKMVKDRPFEGEIKYITIKKEIDGYYACVTTDAVKNIRCDDESQVIGLDRLNNLVDSKGWG